MIKNETTKMTIPTRANTRALATLCIIWSMLLSSGVMMVKTVNRAVRTGIVADRLGRNFHFIHLRQTPAIKLGNPKKGQNSQAIDQIELANHSSPPEEIEDRAETRPEWAAWSLSCHRMCSKLMDRQVISSAGTSSRPAAIRSQEPTG